MKSLIRIVLAAAVLIAGVVGFKLLSPSLGKLSASNEIARKEKSHKEEGEHGNDSTEMSDAKIAAARIRLRTAEAAVLSDTLLLNGVLRANQETLTQVTPRFPGIVREIRKRIGDAVQKGDLLATIESN